MLELAQRIPKWQLEEGSLRVYPEYGLYPKGTYTFVGSVEGHPITVSVSQNGPHPLVNTSVAYLLKVFANGFEVGSQYSERRWFSQKLRQNPEIKSLFDKVGKMYIRKLTDEEVKARDLASQAIQTRPQP